MHPCDVCDAPRAVATLVSHYWDELALRLVPGPVWELCLDCAHAFEEMQNSDPAWTSESKPA